MKLLNTSYLSDRMVLRVLRFVRPKRRKKGERNPQPSKLLVRCTSKETFIGSAEPDSGKIRVWLGRRTRFPFLRRRMAGGYATVRLVDPIEALVYVLAHEWRHLWQLANSDLPRLNGGRGVFSEVDADAYAIGRLEAWRKRS